jgi:chitodextrinase
MDAFVCNPPPDTQPPTSPTELTASAASSAQIDLSWTVSTDNVGVVEYRVERRQGACSRFAQIGTASATDARGSFSDAGLSASTTYSYRVRAADAASNLSCYSRVVSATTTQAARTAGHVTYEYDSFGRLKQVTVVPQ